MVTKSTTNLLKKIYYDPEHPAGFGNVDGLYHAAKRKQKKIRRNQVENFLQKQETYTLHRPVRLRFERRKTLARHVDQVWQADLIDFQPISKENRGFRYILTVIDVLSRYAFATPVKDKTGKSMVTAFKKIFSTFKRIPKKLNTDSGPEFFNKTFKDFLRQKKIILYSTASDVKAACVERFNRTLKAKMYKYFTAKKTLHYLRVLPSLLRSYNQRKHRAHGKAPVKINHNNEKIVWQTLYGSYLKAKPKKPKYRVGDLVRLAKIRKTFQKSYLKGWTDEIFKIYKVNQTNPLTYYIIDTSGEVLRGSFYEYELSKIRL